MSDKDTIIVNDVGTDKEEIWITIKDASDLLGYSERHTWRIAQSNGWKTKKELNQLKKKTFVPRKDVELFYNKEHERQPMDTLGKPDKSAMADKNSILDMSDITMSDKVSAINTQNTFPAMILEYKKSFHELQENKAILLQKVTFWKTSLFWLLALVTITVSVLLYTLSDKIHTLAEQKESLNNQKTIISLLNSNVSGLSDKLTSMSDNVESMSDKVIKTQNSLDIANKQIVEQNKWINELKKYESQPQSDLIPNKSIKRGEQDG